jgi:2-polyprenyl-3-methyl-5-hydroxy-6-metoxy-1,4-benzoquinol methylase
MADSKTILYYDEHGEAYARETLPLRLDLLYKPFLSRLFRGAHILDAGCGSGRDSKYFLDAGFRVTAFDASREMVRISSAVLGMAVKHQTFEDLDYESEFDGVWANASLLHVPRGEIRFIMERLARALRPGGLLFASFKYGNGEAYTGGRLFNSYDESSFESMINLVEQLRMEEQWITKDTRPGKAGERWLNVILTS